MGRERSRPLRPDWEQMKNIMRQAVLRKFETHADICEVLLSTGDELIIEKSPLDYYWGCGTDSSGKNMLGQILMEVREILRCLCYRLLKPGGLIGFHAFANTAFIGGVAIQKVVKKYGVSLAFSKPTGTIEKCHDLLQQAGFEAIEI